MKQTDPFQCSFYSLKEVAKYFQVHRQSLHRVMTGVVPARGKFADIKRVGIKVGGQWRYLREHIHAIE